MMDDATYREKLIEDGVRPEMVATLTGYDLDCIGNIRQVYRTSMSEQVPQFVRMTYPWWKFWRGRWNSEIGLRQETDAQFAERIKTTIRSEWIRLCADEICKFYGAESRDAAEYAAEEYVTSQSEKDDPIGAAVLIMEGWSMN